MGKTTRHHPVSLHVVRGAVEYCGFKFGSLKQIKSDPTGMTALYRAEVVIVPPRCKDKSPEFLRFALQDCFNADIKVLGLSWASSGKITATIRTMIYKDPDNLALPAPEIEPLEFASKKGGGGGGGGIPTDGEKVDRVKCPSCGSFDWRTYDETSRPCWNDEGRQCGDVIYTGFVCKTCQTDWMLANRMSEMDCWCEEY